MDTPTLVRQAREDAGLNRAELARLAGVAPSTVNRIEAGEIDPTVGVLEQVLAATGLSLHAHLSPVSDPASVAAARALIDPDLPPVSDTWTKRWADAGYLVDRRPRDWPQLARTAARTAALAGRPGAKHYVRSTSWWAITKSFSDAGIDWAATGGRAAEALGADGPSPWPVFYVDDVEVAAESTRMRPTGQLVRTTLIPFDEASRVGVYEDQNGRWVDPLQVVIDCLSGTQLTRSQAEQIISGWAENG